MIADGEWRDAALAYDRAFYLFDSANLEGARLAWKLLAGRDGVEVRAEHEAGQPRPLAFIAPGDVADRIHARRHARLAHPAHDEVGRGPVFG